MCLLDEPMRYVIALVAGRCEAMSASPHASRISVSLPLITATETLAARCAPAPREPESRLARSRHPGVAPAAAAQRPWKSM